MEREAEKSRVDNAMRKRVREREQASERASKLPELLHLRLQFVLLLRIPRLALPLTPHRGPERVREEEEIREGERGTEGEKRRGGSEEEREREREREDGRPREPALYYPVGTHRSPPHRSPVSTTAPIPAAQHTPAAIKDPFPSESNQCFVPSRGANPSDCDFGPRNPGASNKLTCSLTHAALPALPILLLLLLLLLHS
jgi:hypothetical protein